MPHDKRAVDRGYYFSVNSEMLKSPKHRALVEQLPADRLLTETDGPFVLSEGIPVRPLSVAKTVVDLARVRGVDPNDMKAQILENLLILVSQ